MDRFDLGAELSIGAIIERPVSGQSPLLIRRRACIVLEKSSYTDSLPTSRHSNR
jgi:hypothetical protein